MMQVTERTRESTDASRAGTAPAYSLLLVRDEMKIARLFWLSLGLVAACGSRMDLGVEAAGPDAAPPNVETTTSAAVPTTTTDPGTPAPPPTAAPTADPPEPAAPTAVPPAPPVPTATPTAPPAPPVPPPPAVDPCQPANASSAQVARWGFDEGQGLVAADSSGRAHAGAIVGATWIEDGVVGRALHFDGSDYVRVARQLDLDIDGAITMIAWIRPSTLDELQLTIMSKASSATVGYDMGLYTGDMLFGRVGGADGQGRTLRKSGGVPAGQWQQVAVTYDGSVGSLYHNGALAHQKTIGGGNGVVPSDLFIGMPADRTSLAFMGDIAEVQVFGTVLSAADIAAQYRCIASRSRFQLPEIAVVVPQPIVGPPAPIPALPVSSDGLVAYYPFSLSGKDASGKGNDTDVKGPVPTSDRFGNANGAYSFNGAGDSVSRAQPIGLPSGSAPRTIAGWFNSDQPKQYISTLFGFGSPSYGANFQLTIGPASLTDYPVVFRVNGWGDGSDWRTGVDPAPLMDGKWHHAAVTYDGQMVTFFVDGIAKASSARSYYTSPQYVTIGAEIGSDGTPFKGALDDVVIFSRALSTAEIAKLAAN